MRRLQLAAAFLVALVAGSSPAAEFEDTLGTHIVEEGETLWSITELYLGADFLWRENWRLNPDIDDPNYLVPGQQIVVIKEREIIAESAAVEAVSNRVDKNLQRAEWVVATAGDELQERDGLRTLEDSSAELRFTDASMLRLSEFSQVFLETKAADIRGRDSGRIEVEEGAADLVFEPIEPRLQADIELVAGAAVARPRPNPEGVARVRATRAADTGTATFMVFEGSTTIESGGRTVEMTEGQGASISESGVLSEPETLLPAPDGLSPANGVDWVAANEPLTWNAVDGAESYIVEICRDPECGVLIQRQADVAGAAWQPRLTQGGSYYWRVTPVSASGLDGFASRPTGFNLPIPVVDLEPPTVAIVPIGPAQPYQRNTVLLGEMTKIRFLTYDDATGVELVEFRGRGGDWQPWDGEDLPISTVGRNLIEVRATDRVGRRSQVFSARIGTMD